jgi:hypothetical protein
MGRMIEVVPGGSVPSYYTVSCLDPAMDLQYGNMLSASLRAVPGVLMAAVVISADVGVVKLEVDAPDMTLDAVQALVKQCLLARARQVACLLRSLEGGAGPDADAVDHRVFTMTRTAPGT